MTNFNNNSLSCLMNLQITITNRFNTKIKCPTIFNHRCLALNLKTLLLETNKCPITTKITDPSLLSTPIRHKLISKNNKFLKRKNETPMQKRSSIPTSWSANRSSNFKIPFKKTEITNMPYPTENPRNISDLKPTQMPTFLPDTMDLRRMDNKSYPIHSTK